MKRLHRLNFARRGVTIVELLIVAGIFFLMIAALAPFMKMVRARANIVNCGNNLREISLGLHNYAADHDDEFPPDLKALYPDYVASEKDFDCPAAASAGTAERPDYGYTAALTESSSPKEIIVQDIDGNHRKTGRNILRIDGSVEFVSRR